MSVQLKFKIDKKGIVELAVDGVQGASCSDITRAFETELGVVTETQQLPEFYDVIDNMEIHINES